MRFVLRFASNSQYAWFVYVCMCICGTNLLPLFMHALIWVCMCMYVCLSTSGSEIQIRVCLKSSLLGYTRHSQRNKHPKAQSSFSFLFCCSLLRDVLIVLNFKIFFLFIKKLLIWNLPYIFLYCFFLVFF